VADSQTFPGLIERVVPHLRNVRALNDDPHEPRHACEFRRPALLTPHMAVSGLEMQLATRTVTA